MDYIRPSERTIMQRLTPEGVRRIYQSMDEKSYDCHSLLRKSQISAITFVNIIRKREVCKSSIELIFYTLGLELQPDFVVYPLTADKKVQQRRIYPSKQERNNEIIAEYDSGKGLRQLEQKFGLSRSGIRNILEKSGIYKGDDEGRKRNKTGDWVLQEDAQIRAERMEKSKRTGFKQIRRNLLNKRISAGMSQQQMAEAIGVSKAHYCMVENASETPSEATWSKIEALFGLEEGCHEIRKVSAAPKRKTRR